MAFYPFKDEEGNEHGSCEVFYMTAAEIGASWDYARIGDEGPRSGWYWWPCFPGCLPDGEPSGPFASEGEAREDAGCA